AMTTFGTIEAAEAAIGHVKRIHDRGRGTDALGRPYWGSDPDLLLFVHDAEIDSFLRAYQRYGPTRLTRSEADTYVAQPANAARLPERWPDAAHAGGGGHLGGPGRQRRAPARGGSPADVGRGTAWATARVPLRTRHHRIREGSGTVRAPHPARRALGAAGLRA